MAIPKANSSEISTEKAEEESLNTGKNLKKEQVIAPEQPELQAKKPTAAAALQNKEIIVPPAKLQSHKKAAEDSSDNELRKRALASIKLAEDYINSYYSKNDYKGFLDWPSIAVYSAKRNSGTGKNGKALEWKEKYIKQGNDFDLSRATDYQRSILGIISAGGNPGSFAGMNLVEAVKKSQLSSGKFADTIEGKGERLINSHVWGVISLYSAGERILGNKGAYNWLVSNQNTDGGFGISTGSKSDLDMTAMALSAFSALGKKTDDKHVLKAVEYIKANQTAAGGFEVFGQENPDTACAVVQGLISLGINPVSEEWIKENDKNMIDFIVSFQLSDGGFCHTRGGETDMLTTSRALTALADYYYGKSVYQTMNEM